MRNDNYINIQGWMINEFRLSGNELLLYALIYGFSQDGESEYCGSQRYMAESLGVSRECVLRIINRLEEKGLLIKIPNNNLFKGKIRYRAVRRCEKKSHNDVMNCHNGCDELSHNNTSNNIETKEEDKSSKKAEIDEFVERVYKLYPAKCPKRNASLGKSGKDKERIKKLLKTYTQDEILAVVEEEVRTKYGISWMQNFSTFLNNFPDPALIMESKKAIFEDSNDDELVIDNVEYK